MLASFDMKLTSCLVSLARAFMVFNENFSLQIFHYVCPKPNQFAKFWKLPWSMQAQNRRMKVATNSATTGFIQRWKTWRKRNIFDRLLNCSIEPMNPVTLSGLTVTLSWFLLRAYCSYQNRHCNHPFLLRLMGSPSLIVAPKLLTPTVLHLFYPWLKLD